MNAQQARQEAEANADIKFSVEYQEILGCIKAEVKAGKMSASWYAEMSQEVKDRLKQDGFAIKADFHMNEYSYTISW